MMILDISPHIERFISSQVMEDSEMQERLIYLGNKLQENFEKYSGDEMGAWISHYIAEKMIEISTADGKEKASSQRECFEAILILWDYQSRYLPDMRPFKNFDPIFRALSHIDPNKSSPSYFRNSNGDKKPTSEIEQTIELISGLDNAARIMISFFVRESMLHTTDETTLEWLRAIDGIDRPDEVKIIFKLLPELDVSATKPDDNEERKKELSEQIDRLEAFENLSKNIKTVLKTELEAYKTEK